MQYALSKSLHFLSREFRCSLISAIEAFLIIFMAAPQFFTGGQLHAQTPPAVAPAASTEISMDKLKDFYSALADMKAELPRDEFDPATVAYKIGNNPEALKNWVSENITWVPYRGHLRSPSAVIMDGSGNSLDQAVLLAHLLELVGSPAELHTRKVSSEWVTQHLLSDLKQADNIRPPLLPQNMEIPQEITAPEQRALFNDYMSGRQNILMEVVRRTENQLPTFASQVKKTDIKNFNKSVLPQNHWWVSVPDAGDASRLDPTGAPEIEASARYTSKELPAEVLQTVDIIVKIEQLKAGKTQEHTLLTHRFDAAETSNRHLQIGFIPDGISLSHSEFNQDPEKALDSLMGELEKVSEWMPYIKYGDKTFSDLAFTASGDTKAKLGSTAQADALNSAAGVLGGLGGVATNAKSSDGKLSAVRIEMVSSAPGLEPITQTRTLYERKDTPNPPAPGLVLNSATDVLIQTSFLRRNYVTDLALAHNLSMRNAALGSNYYAQKEDEDKLHDSLNKMTIFPQEIYDFALTRFMLNPNQNHIQLTRPNLIGYHQTLSVTTEGEGRLVLGFDLIQNDIDILPNNTKSPEDLRLYQGLTESALEAVLSLNENTNSNSASTLLEKIPSENWTWISTVADMADLQGELSTEIKQQLTQRLQAGDMLLVPENLASLSSSEAAWWELQPETGKLVGRISTGGWGGAMSEYLVNLYVAKAAILLLAISYMMCKDDPGASCMICTVLSAAVIIGGIFAPGIGTATAVVISGMLVNVGCAVIPTL